MYEFKDVSAEARALKVLPSCTDPDTSIDCRTIVVPTNKTRIYNGNLKAFRYKFIISAYGGDEI